MPYPMRIVCILNAYQVHILDNEDKKPRDLLGHPLALFLPEPRRVRRSGDARHFPGCPYLTGVAGAGFVFTISN